MVGLFRSNLPLKTIKKLNKILKVSKRPQDNKELQAPNTGKTRFPVVKSQRKENETLCLRQPPKAWGA